MKIFIGFICITTLFVSCGEEDLRLKNQSDQESQYFLSLAKFYGASEWEKVDTARFTFVYTTEDTTAKRCWEWLPKESQVTFIPYTLKDSAAHQTILDNDTLRKITYKTTQWNRDDRHLIAIDRHFVNDRKWLLLPVLFNNASLKITISDSIKAPISGQMRDLMIIKENAPPEDVYELYINDSLLITESVYKLRGSELNSLTTSWGNYQRYGPFLIARKYENKEGTFKILLEDIRISIETD